jgi:hypothetical protein
MSTVKPKNEKMKNAIKWISDEKKFEKKDIETLIQDACFKFNLSPNDAEFIDKFMKEKTR